MSNLRLTLHSKLILYAVLVLALLSMKMSKKIEKPSLPTSTCGQKESVMVNLNINPILSFPIHRRYGENTCELAEACRKLWKNVRKSSKSPLPLGFQPNMLIRTKRDELPVHHFVIAAFSDNTAQWTAMCAPPVGQSTYQMELNLAEKCPTITKEALWRVIQFLYIAKIRFAVGELPEILEAANFFGVTELKNRIGEYIVQLAKQNPSTITNCLQLSFTFTLPVSVRTQLVTMTADQFTTFLSVNNGQDLYDLSGDVVEAVLSSNDLDARAPIEVSVFTFVVKWLRKNRKDAPKFATALINICRFDKMTTPEKYHCLEEARSAGLDHLIRSKIMAADWQKTCQAWEQSDKCNRPLPKRKNFTDLPPEPRGPPKDRRETDKQEKESEMAGIGKDEITDQETPPFSEEKFLKSESERSQKAEHLAPKEAEQPLMAKSSTWKAKEIPEQSSVITKKNDLFGGTDSTKTKGALVWEESEELKGSQETPLGNGSGSQKSPQAKKDKKKAKSKSRRSSKSSRRSRREKRRSKKKVQQKSFRELSEKSEDMKTPEELVDNVPGVDPNIPGKSRKSPELEEDLQSLTYTDTYVKPGRNAELREAVSTITNMLNKKGRHCLMQRLMEPEFGQQLRQVLVDDGLAPKLKSPLRANVVLGSEMDDNSLPESQFFYSPESREYKSYLDTMKGVGNEPTKESAVTPSVVPAISPAVVKKPFNGGRPLTFRQSVIRENEKETVSYEQKYFREAPDKSRRDELNRML